MFVLGAELVCARLGVRVVSVTDASAVPAALAATRAPVGLVSLDFWRSRELERCAELSHAFPLTDLGVVTSRASPFRRDRARGLGFAAFLVKQDLTPAKLEAAIAGLLAGESYYADPVARDQPTSVLSPREAQVLRLLAQGDQTRTIARRLRLAERTVKATIAAATQRLGAANRAEAVAIACELGVIAGALDPQRAGAVPGGSHPRLGVPAPRRGMLPFRADALPVR
jgi:two-component system response regulator DesR